MWAPYLLLSLPIAVLAHAAWSAAGWRRQPRPRRADALFLADAKKRGLAPVPIKRRPRGR
jgi:hypothetical protein